MVDPIKGLLRPDEYDNAELPNVRRFWSEKTIRILAVHSIGTVLAE